MPSVPVGRWAFCIRAGAGQCVDAAAPVGDRRQARARRGPRRHHRPRARVPRLSRRRAHDGARLHGLSALRRHVARSTAAIDRIAAQIVAGIGFIGAGLIFREGYSVTGVTTAATIWATAAVGIAIGIEGYIVAVAGAIFSVILLELTLVTKNIRPQRRYRKRRSIGLRRRSRRTAAASRPTRCAVTASRRR